MDYHKEYRIKNAEKIKLKKQAHYQRNKEKYIAMSKLWKASNPEKVKLYAKTDWEKRKKDPICREKAYLSLKQWRLNNIANVNKKANHLYHRNKLKDCPCRFLKNYYEERVYGTISYKPRPKKIKPNILEEEELVADVVPITRTINNIATFNNNTIMLTF